MAAYRKAQSAPHTLGRVRASLGLSRHAVARLIDLGFVQPARNASGAYAFSFQDLVLLRSAHELRLAGLPTRRLLKALSGLHASLPREAPREGFRIVAVGDRLAVRMGKHQWEPTSGQLVMDFGVSDAVQGEVAYLPQQSPCRAEADFDKADVESLFAEAEAWEELDQHGAERLYRRVLERDPAHVHAYLNLGYMLCEQARREEAVALYERAFKACGNDDPLIFYNHAVALDGLGRAEAALKSYEMALELKPDLLEAHQNAALLYAELGDKKKAIRHFNALRHLERSVGQS